MSTVMQNRIRKIEAVVTPPPPPPPVTWLLLGEPQNATLAAMRAFNAELQALLADGCKVIVLRALRSLREFPDGVESYDPEADDRIAVGARAPSRAGKRAQLDEVLQGLSGKTIRPRTERK